MNKQTEIYFSKISKEHTNELTTIVKETINMEFFLLIYLLQLICGLFSAEENPASTAGI